MTPEKKRRVATAAGFLSGMLACLDAMRELKEFWPPDVVWQALRSPQRLELGAGADRGHAGDLAGSASAVGTLTVRIYAATTASLGWFALALQCYLTVILSITRFNTAARTTVPTQDLFCFRNRTQCHWHQAISVICGFCFFCHAGILGREDIRNACC
jgi:hypothetical protein